jgi:penicillin-binding protein 1B
LGILKNPTSGLSVFPAFLDVVRRQLKQEYQEDDLNSTGLRIFTTLDPRVQQSAESAFNQQVARLRNAGKRTNTSYKVQWWLLILKVANCLAVVGGYGTFTGFNRAIDASRQVGSLFKPAVYLTALATGKFNLVSP